MSRRHQEDHRTDRAGWLRAAVLGANDGLVSNACLLLGIAAGGASPHTIALAGTAGLVAGAMSMAAGEYVSVSSQHDTEMADLERERAELKADPEGEKAELAQIYARRGADAATARTVADELMAKDALAAHARDELGITPDNQARPIQAALTSAVTFASGAALPLLIAIWVAPGHLILAESSGALLVLALLGAIGGKAGGANMWRAAARVLFWGALALAVTAGIGGLVGTAI